MSNVPTNEMQSERVRSTFTRFARRRGSDAGREVDHLKLRSLSPEVAQTLSAAEAGGLAVPPAGELTRRDGDATAVLWLFDVSRFDGSDRL